MSIEFNKEGLERLGATMDVLNTRIEVKESKENLERIKNEIKTTKVKLVRDRIGMFAFWTGLVAATSVVTTTAAEKFTVLNAKSMLCLALGGVCAGASYLFAHESTNKKDKLSNLHDEEAEATEKCESLAKAHDDAVIKYYNLVGDENYDNYLSVAESIRGTDFYEGVTK